MVDVGGVRRTRSLAALFVELALQALDLYGKSGTSWIASAHILARAGSRGKGSRAMSSVEVMAGVASEGLVGLFSRVAVQVDFVGILSACAHGCCLRVFR